MPYSSEVMTENEKELRLRMLGMLNRCTESQKNVFRLMYDPKGKCENAVDNIPADKMDWAFYQLEQTHKINQKRSAG